MDRDKSIDVAKGIGIISVLIGHDILIPHYIRNAIFSFHMPLFFILSGYYFHEQDIKHSILGGGKLLKYYILAAFLIFLIIIVTNPIGIYKYLPATTGEIIKATIFANGCKSMAPIWGSIKPIAALWFLPALFWCKVLYNLIYKITNIHNSLFWLCISFCMVIVSTKYINIPFGVSEGVSALIFYSLGVSFKRGLERHFVFISILLWIFTCPFISLDIAAFKYSIYPLNIITGFGGTVFILYLSRILTATPISNYLSIYGRYSLYVFLIHSILLYIILYCFQYHGIFRGTINTITCISIVSIIYIFQTRNKRNSL